MCAHRSETFEQILSEQVLLFREAIKEKCKPDSMAIHPYCSDYPLFRPANKEYFEYEYFEGLLEWYIRDYLITGVLKRWLEKTGRECIIPQEDPKRIRFRYSGEQFGDEHPFAMIIRTVGMSIGVRYSSLCLDEKRIRQLIRKHKIDHIEIIDWSDTDSLKSEKTVWGVSPEQRNMVFFVTLHEFMDKYFPRTLFYIYRNKVRAAVAEANNEIGFQTIPKLSLRYLSDFKTSVLQNLKQFPLRRQKYTCFDRSGNSTGEFVDLLPNDVYDTIEKNCFETGAYTALIGPSSFATCFLTSEYLYQVFSAGGEHNFDYSAIASGYFKSVELLLETIMQLTFKQEGHDRLYIMCNPKYKSKIPDDQRQTNKATGKTQVIFSRENEKYFSTEMGPLIWFLHDNALGWNVDSGQETIHSCLYNYNLGCRNGHLHKHIIDEIKTVRTIRDNTIICLLYLLGACIPNNDYSSLGLVDDSYVRR